MQDSAWRASAARGVGLLLLAAAPVHAKPHLQGVAETSLGYTDNAQAAPSGAGSDEATRARSVFLMLSPGAVLAFAKALGEFGATITFVSNIPGETQTIPAAIYTYTQTPGGDAGALRLSLIAVAISLAALVASELLSRRTGQRRAGLE